MLQVLKNAHVQIVASTIADTAEYGIYRVICTEPQRAFDALKEAGVAVALSEVFALELDNEPGCAAEAVRTISDAGISIVYLYSFLFYGKGILIFRTDNVDEARQIIKANGMKYLTEGDLAD